MEAAAIEISLTWFDWAIILFYLAAMICVGFFFRKKQQSFEDYFLASKGLTMPLMAVSYTHLDVYKRQPAG